jgi:hypothetical protein
VSRLVSAAKRAIRSADGHEQRKEFDNSRVGSEVREDKHKRRSTPGERGEDAPALRSRLAPTIAIQTGASPRQAWMALLRASAVRSRRRRFDVSVCGRVVRPRHPGRARGQQFGASCDQPP